MNKKVNIGIGFVTGRKNFKQVLKTHVLSLRESGVLGKGQGVHLFVAYDLAYTNTKAADYVVSDLAVKGLLDSAHYLGDDDAREERRRLVRRGVLTEREAALLLGGGYSGRRNMILYQAVKSKMDYLLFLDDDEYPMAAVMDGQLGWVGQEVLATHMRTLPDCDITHGHQCGYTSPIPSIAFNEQLTEDDFQVFIEAVSNDIISWPSIKAKMEAGGMSYADTGILGATESRPVREANHMKFISGSNLGLNLKRPERLFPFYNPPGARGEDTFLSTCLHNRDVQKVPCYTFHDGFSAYPQLLNGVMPGKLSPINAKCPAVQKRFFQAAVGWIRYKPLLLSITDPDHYREELQETRARLLQVVPRLCAYFDNPDFSLILRDLDRYAAQIPAHTTEFADTKSAWKKAVAYLTDGDSNLKAAI